jgi:hypothetical protein
MLIAGLFAALGAAMAGGVRLRRTDRRMGRAAVALAAVLLALGVPALFESSASAAIVAPVPLGTTSSFSVLAGSTVANTGPTTMDRNLGLSPGSSVTGFPPGTVNPPATMEVANAVAVQAQSDLTTAYDNAAGRPLDATTGADLAGLTLQGGVYAATSTKAPLGLTGTLTLDGANNSDSVWVFQTDSTLTTASSSTVNLINGAMACHVYWQVGSSATLGTSTTFVGSILAQTSISMGNAVTVNGRALARTGAVTLINDAFTGPECTPSATTTTAASTTSSSGPTTSGAPTTSLPGTTTSGPTTTVVPTTSIPGVTTTVPGSTRTVTPVTTTASPTTTTVVADRLGTTTTTGSSGARSSTTTTAVGNLRNGPTTTTRPAAGTVIAGGAPTTTVLVTLPRTGSQIGLTALSAATAFAAGALAVVLADRRRKSVAG